MSIRERLYDFFFYMVIGTLYCFALSSAVFDATILPVTYARLFLLSAVFMLFFFLLFYNKWTMIGVGAAALLALLIVFIRLWQQDFQSDWLQGIMAFGREIVLFYRGAVSYREEYGIILPLVTTGLIAFLAALNLRLEYNFFLLMLLGVGVIAIPIWAEWGSSPVAIPVFLFCFLVLLAKRLNLFALVKGKGKEGRNDGFTLAMIPVSLVALVMASLIPAPDFAFSPIGAPTDTPDNLFDFAGDLFGERGDTTISYSEEGGRLGGPNERDEEVLIMEVKADERVYLSGSVRDSYSGSSWDVSGKAREVIVQQSDGAYLTSEYSQELSDQQDYWMRYYAQEVKSVSVYTATRTKSLFAPPYRTDMWFGDDSFAGGNELRMNADGALTAKKTLEQNTSYGQRYMAFDFTNGYIVKVLQERAAADTGDASLAPYLALPADLPDRVGELAEELTAGYGNNYDKLRAIERHLAQFPYTLTPDNVPRGEDFVDYFLFTGQEGYCVYFASALAVMGRIVGIPTRYIEGYSMPSSRQENGNFRVTAMQAHAWVEAFFPGFGWVPFEATPPSYEQVYGERPQDVEPSPLPTEMPEDPPEDTDIPQPETSDEADSSDPQADDPSQPDEQDPEDRSQSEPAEESSDSSDADENGVTPANTVVVALLSLLAIAGLSALFVLVMRRAYKRKFGKLEQLPAGESVPGYFASLLGAASALGHPIGKGETAHQFAERVGDELTFADGAVTMKMLADIFARAAYSEQEIPAQDAVLMKQCYNELLERLQQTKKGKLRFLINRYILLRF